MLLRSSSTPVLQSLLPEAAECFLQITPKSRSCSFDHDRIKKISRNLSESDLTIRGTSTCIYARLLVPVEDDIAEEDEAEMGCKVGDAEAVVGGSGGDWSGVGAGGWGSGYGDGDGDDDGGYGWCWDANNGNTSMDLYYEKMIETNPRNSMLLSNYAVYLKEVRGIHEHYFFYLFPLYTYYVCCIVSFYIYKIH